MSSKKSSELRLVGKQSSEFGLVGNCQTLYQPEDLVLMNVISLSLIFLELIMELIFLSMKLVMAS